MVSVVGMISMMLNGEISVEVSVEFCVKMETFSSKVVNMVVTGISISVSSIKFSKLIDLMSVLMILCNFFALMVSYVLRLVRFSSTAMMLL